MRDTAGRQASNPRKMGIGMAAVLLAMTSLYCAPLNTAKGAGGGSGHSPIQDQAPPTSPAAEVQSFAQLMEATYPTASYGNFPADIRDALRNADIEINACGRSDSANALRACNRAYRALQALERRNWCLHGNDRNTQERWQSCSDSSPYRAGGFDGAPPFSDAMIEAAFSPSPAPSRPAASPGDVARYYPPSLYTRYPATVRDLLREADMADDSCWGRSDDPETLRACNRGDVQLAEAERRGWCYGGNDVSVAGHWRPCRDYDEYPTRLGRKPPYPESSIAEVGRSPEYRRGQIVARIARAPVSGETPAAGPATMHRVMAILLTQGFSRSLENELELKWLGSARGERVQYDIYSFIHTSLPNGHGNQALVVIANGSRYVGHYDIGGDDCRMKDEVVACRVDNAAEQGSTVSFRGGRLPGRVLVGPSFGDLTR